MKRILCGFLAASLLLPAISSGAQNFKNVNVGKATPVKVEAVGAEFDPHFYAQNVVGRPGDGAKAEDFSIVDSRVTEMGLQKFRVMVQPQWYEPYNDNDDPFVTDFSAFRWNTVEMQSLCQVLDLAQKNNMQVCLAIWGCTRHVSMVEKEYADVKACFMKDGDANKNWMCPPEDNDEFGENFAALVKYLIDEKGYTCVTEITPFNEPGGDIIKPDGYMDVCRALDSHFKRLGVRDKVRFNLSDNIDTHQYYLRACAKELKGIADIFNSHTYIFGYETPNRKVMNWERRNVRISKRAGLNHIVGEFGSNQCVGASRQRDIDTYGRGILMARHVLNFFNAGACAVSYWGLIDQYYGYQADYEQMQQLGLWRYVKEAYAQDTTYARISCDYECRPQYYAYAMISSNVRPGAEIHPLELGHKYAAGTAFRNADGKWVYVFANAESEPLHLAVANDAEGEYEVIRYEKETLPSDGSLIKPEGTLAVSEGRLKVTVAPDSVVLCRQK